MDYTVETCFFGNWLIVAVGFAVKCNKGYETEFTVLCFGLILLTIPCRGPGVLLGSLITDGAHYCNCACFLRISRYSDFL